VSPADQQACLNALVMQKQQELSNKQQQPTHLVGSSCGTVSPSSFQACLNSYVVTMQTALNSDAAPGDLVATCDQSDQSCINSYVIDMQQQGGLLGGCAGVAPDFKQTCINNYVLSLQQKRSIGNVAQAPGAFSMSASASSTKVSSSTSAVHVTTVRDN
jgi:hypothetical protein